MPKGKDNMGKRVSYVRCDDKNKTRWRKVVDSVAISWLGLWGGVKLTGGCVCGSQQVITSTTVFVVRSVSVSVCVCVCVQEHLHVSIGCVRRKFARHNSKRPCTSPVSQNLCPLNRMQLLKRPA